MLCDLDLDPITLKCKLIRGIVIFNVYLKLYRNWIINEVARAMTKGEHTNESTYVRTFTHTHVQDRPYIPSTTLMCEGITSTTKYRLHENSRRRGHRREKYARGLFCDLNPNFFLLSFVLLSLFTPYLVILCANSSSLACTGITKVLR